MESSKKRWNVYTIRRRPGMKKGYWLKIGAAFLNGDGSVNLYLDAAPLDGKLQLREWEEQPASLPVDANGALEMPEDVEAF